MQDDRPVVISVHPLLKEELQQRKEQIEKKNGYRLHGGIPIVSKMAALELKKLREHKIELTDEEKLKYTKVGKITVLVHPDLKEELCRRHKELLEEMTNNNTAITHENETETSFIAAYQLKKIRQKKYNVIINMELHKKKGVKRVEVLKLW